MNLLPDHLLQAARRRSRRGRHRVYVAAAALAAALWLAAASAQIRVLRHRVMIAEREAEPVRERARYIAELERKREGLLDEQRTLEAIRNPVPVAALLAMLSHLVPEDVIVHRIGIDVPPAVLPDPDGQGRRRPVHGSSPPMTVRVEGVAGREASVPALLSDLSGSGVFTDVRLVSTHEEVIDGSLRHFFRMVMGIPLSEHGADAVTPGYTRR